MDLLQLQYFRTIAKLENLTRAAELLYVAQPNLSVSMSKLEDELGVSLFDRRKGKICLTPTGRVFLEHVENGLDEIAAAIDSVREFDDVNKNHVRVAGSIVDLMGDLLAEFLPDNGDISFRQLNCPNKEVPARVLSSEVDFGILYGLPSVSGLEYMALDSCERGLMLRSDHPLAGRQSVSLKELRGERFICNMSRDDGDFLEELKHITGYQPRIGFECDAIQVELNLMLTGKGIELVPVTHYLKLLRTDPGLPLRYIRVKEPLPEVSLGMVRRQGCILTDAALRFFNYIASFFKHENQVTRDFLKTL